MSDYSDYYPQLRKARERLSIEEPEQEKATRIDNWFSKLELDGLGLSSLHQDVDIYLEAISKTLELSTKQRDQRDICAFVVRATVQFKMAYSILQQMPRHDILASTITKVRKLHEAISYKSKAYRCSQYNSKELLGRSTEIIRMYKRFYQ